MDLNKRPLIEKSAISSTSGTLDQEQTTLLHDPPALAGKRLCIELPTPKRTYTTNSAVAGIVHCIPNVIKITEENETHREITRLFHCGHTLWSRRSVDEIPPSSLPFVIRIPESGIDSKRVSLPPSFYATRTWSAEFIGSVSYCVKARLIRKGFFKFNAAVAEPFIFLPPSDPPPLLPLPPESISDRSLGQLRTLWTEFTVSATIRKYIFSRQGKARLSLWLPRVEKFPRKTSVPFFLYFRLRTARGKFQEQGPPPLLSSLPRLDRASVHIQRTVRVRAGTAVQTHTKTYYRDNFLYSLVPQESDWRCISDSNEPYWEKGYLWRGHWEFRETPNFTNRQLTVKYFLVAEVPIKGLGNDITLFSQPLDICTGIPAGQTPMTVEPELLPGYFDLDAVSDEDDDEHVRNKNKET